LDVLVQLHIAPQNPKTPLSDHENEFKIFSVKNRLFTWFAKYYTRDTLQFFVIDNHLWVKRSQIFCFFKVFRCLCKSLQFKLLNI